jgi:hypothetical protein
MPTTAYSISIVAEHNPQKISKALVLPTSWKNSPLWKWHCVEIEKIQGKSKHGTDKRINGIGINVTRILSLFPELISLVMSKVNLKRIRCNPKNLIPTNSTCVVTMTHKIPCHDEEAIGPNSFISPHLKKCGA